MPSLNIVREIDLVRTPRVMQLESLFDIPITEKNKREWDINLPLDDKPWNIGLIVGPSGSGKSTILKEFFNESIFDGFEWSEDKSVIDSFPEGMGIKDITFLLSSVGFSSPPSWMKPYHVLSTGEKFRVTMARVLAESKALAVVDEFTSVIDRTVAQIGSSAVAKTIRKRGQQFIAATCHYDVIEWLQPDWIFSTLDNSFEWRFLQQRPPITLEICKVHRSAWEMFKQYHYLTGDIMPNANCFVAYHEQRPVAFAAYTHLVNRYLKKTKKGHRGVVLPDYQGVGIGNIFIEYIASCLKALGFDFIGRNASPIVMQHRAKSTKWKMMGKPGISKHNDKGNSVYRSKYTGRMLCSFQYCGPAAPQEEAKNLICQ